MFGLSRSESLERLVYCSRARIDTTSLQAISELLGVAPEAAVDALLRIVTDRKGSVDPETR